jgi:DNA-binding transcriptional LysR family regulator
MRLDKLDLNKLVTFLTIAESGGVTPAAARLALTRSAVSHSLRVLERELGLSLFHRIGKGLTLTHEGQVLRRAVREMQDQLSGTLDDLAGLGKDVRGPVRLGLFLGFSRFQLAGVLDAFAREHRAASVRVAYGPQAWLIEQLLAGKLDMSLSLEPTGVQASRIRSQRVKAGPLVLVTRRSAGRVPRDFARISALDIIDYYQSDPVIDRWTRHHFAGRRLSRDRIRVWAASSDLALELVLRGTGAAVIPEHIVKPFDVAKQLSVIPGTAAPLLDHVWVNDLSSRRAARAPAVFRALLLQQLGS